MSLTLWGLIIIVGAAVAAWATLRTLRPVLAGIGLFLGANLGYLVARSAGRSLPAALAGATLLLLSVWCMRWLLRWFRVARSPLGTLARRYGVPAECAPQGWWRVTARKGRIVQVDDRDGCTVVVEVARFDVEVTTPDGITLLRGDRPGLGLQHAFPRSTDRDITDMVWSWRHDRAPVDLEIEYLATQRDVTFRGFTVRGPGGAVHHTRR